MYRSKDLKVIFGISTATLHRWIGRVLPKPHYIQGTRIRYWLEEEIKAKIVFFNDSALVRLDDIRTQGNVAKKKVKISV